MNEQSSQARTVIIDKTKENKAEKSKCEEMKKHILSNNPMIKTLRNALKKSGCDLKDGHFKCEPCDDTAFGYFDNRTGLIICQNNLKSESEIANTIVHEMVHAYDWCLFKYDINNCYHNACTEIRAASISDDCSIYYEFMRGKLGLKKHHQECVKRRAILSIKYSECCSEPGKAEEAVEKVFKSCYYDRQPFTLDD